MARVKTKMLTIKVSPETYREYQIAAGLKGGTMSGLVHMFVVQTIRDQKERNPEAFKNGRSDSERPVVRAKIGKSRKTRQANG